MSNAHTFACTHLFQTLLQQGQVDAWWSRHSKTGVFSWISARSGDGVFLNVEAGRMPAQ